MDLAWERNCLARMRRGDREGFSELYRALAPKLYREILMPKLGHAQAAEDALAETFASFLEHYGQLEVRDQSLMHWLARVASNKATDTQRKKASALRLVASFGSLTEPLSAATSTDSALEENQLRELAAREVSHVLATLNPRYRRALELRFFEERSREQCAAQLEVAIGTFDVLLLRALRAFRRDWELAQQAKKRQGDR